MALILMVSAFPAVEGRSTKDGGCCCAAEWRAPPDSSPSGFASRCRSCPSQPSCRVGVAHGGRALHTWLAAELSGEANVVDSKH